VPDDRRVDQDVQRFGGEDDEGRQGQPGDPAQGRFTPGRRGYGDGRLDGAWLAQPRRSIDICNAARARSRGCSAGAGFGSGWVFGCSAMTGSPRNDSV
jgi:hypothetical protein